MNGWLVPALGSSDQGAEVGTFAAKAAKQPGCAGAAPGS